MDDDARDYATTNRGCKYPGSRTQIGPRASTHGPNGGVADSLEKAKAAFRRASEHRKGSTAAARSITSIRVHASVP